jgi:glycosyltransferase involved in cell wall biosynthesis
MKVLVVSNLYPPHHQGGYELRCAQVTEYLRQQGHDVCVVSSDYQIDGTHHGTAVRDDVVDGVRVARFLRQHRLDFQRPGGKRYFIGVVRRQITDATRFKEILDQFKPDVVNWWNLEGVTKIILRMPLDRGIPCVQCIDDRWMIREFGASGSIDMPFWFDFWRVQWGAQLLRPIVRLALGPFEQRMARRGIPTRPFPVPSLHKCFISAYRRFEHEQAGFDVGSSDVIYGGVDPEKFLVARTPADYADGPLRLLYAGYIDVKRGLHTIVEAIGLLPESQRSRIRLSVAYTGPVVPDEYVNRVTARVAALGLSDQVEFLGRIPHGDMPRVYGRHHALVFASTWDEGMPMVMMEAMCAGCAVPNTGSGGAFELSDRAGAPLFPKDHPFALSRLLSALERDRVWLSDLALRGQRTVLQEFTLNQMLKRTAQVLTRVATQGASIEPQETAVAAGRF